MQILSRREAADRSNLSMSSIKRLEKLGLFPKKVKISANRIGYVETEVDAFIEDRIAERDMEAAAAEA